LADEVRLYTRADEIISDVVETFISRPRRGETRHLSFETKARHLDFETEARRDI